MWMNVAGAEVGRLEGDHVAPGGDDGDPGEEFAGPGAGGHHDLVRIKGAAHGADLRVGAGGQRHDLGSLVDVHAGGQQGAMDDRRPALGVDLAIGVEGGAGDIGRQQGFTAAGFVGLDEFDVEAGLQLAGDLGEELLALVVGAGDADGGALDEADVEAAELLEELGEFGEGVAAGQPQANEGCVVVGVVLPADEAAGGGRGFAADATAFEDGDGEPSTTGGQGHGAADDAAAHDGDIGTFEVSTHVELPPAGVGRPERVDMIVSRDGRSFASRRPAWRDAEPLGA